MNHSEFTIGILDNDPCACECIESIVSTYFRMKCSIQPHIWTTTLAPTAIERCMMHTDVLVTDMMLDSTSGFRVASIVRSARPDLPIIGITSYEPSRFMEQAKQSGMVTLLDKQLIRDELPPAIMNSLDVTTSFTSVPDTPIPQLTDNERTVITLYSEGLNSKRVASAMGIAVDTVFSHRHRIKTKFHVQDWHEVMELSRIWHITE